MTMTTAPSRKFETNQFQARSLAFLPMCQAEVWLCAALVCRPNVVQMKMFPFSLLHIGILLCSYVSALSSTARATHGPRIYCSDSRVYIIVMALRSAWHASVRMNMGKKCITTHARFIAVMTWQHCAQSGKPHDGTRRRRHSLELKPNKFKSRLSQF